MIPTWPWQDIELAKALYASSPAAQKAHPTDNEHGVDLILGGHDHLYYIARGATAWEGYDLTHEVLGAERDEGDILIVKSGTDFRDLSEFTLTLEDTPPGSIRRKVIKEIRGAYTPAGEGAQKCGADGSGAQARATRRSRTRRRTHASKSCSSRSSRPSRTRSRHPYARPRLNLTSARSSSACKRWAARPARGASLPAPPLHC